MTIFAVLVLACLLEAYPENPRQSVPYWMSAGVIEMNLKQGLRLVLHLKV